MKKKVNKFLFSGILLLLTCSFSEGPGLNPGSTTGASAMSELRFGGAYVIFAGKFGGEITRKEIARHHDLKVDGCATGSRIFTFTLDVTKDGKTTSLETKSNVLTKEMVTHLTSLMPGDEFEFRNTKAYLPNGKDLVDVHGRKFIVV